MAEINTGSFGGDISAMEGTFSGTLTAQAIDAAANINIAGNSVARTTISTLGRKDGFNDNGYWRSIHSIVTTVPSDDVNGGWYNCSMRFSMADLKDDNGNFDARYRIVVNGVPIYTSERVILRSMYEGIKNAQIDIQGYFDKQGRYEIDLQLVVYPLDTNMYIYFTGIAFRLDYMRK